MDDTNDSYHVYETNGSSPWDAPQHECLDDVDNVGPLRRRIKYYFMNPCEKYHARGRKPWKLVLQIIKIAIITIQVVFSDAPAATRLHLRSINVLTACFAPRVSWYLLD